MALVPCSLEAHTTDLVGPVGLARDPLPKEPGLECKKSDMNQTNYML